VVANRSDDTGRELAAGKLVPELSTVAIATIVLILAESS